MIIALGNPILGDDGVGWVIAEQVSQRVPDVEVRAYSLGGLGLMEQLVGLDAVILIDSLVTGEYPVGTVYNLRLDQLPDISSGHLTSPHDTSLPNALRLGKIMGLPLPESRNIRVIGVEIKPAFDFSEKLTPVVQAAVPQAVAEATSLIHHLRGEGNQQPNRTPAG